MAKNQRIIPATQLRVRLGEALKLLDQEDVIVEKGGVPVAVLIRYAPGWDAEPEGDPMARKNAYAAALVKRGTPNSVSRAVAAMDKGIPGLDAEKAVRDIYEARTAGTKPFAYSLDKEGGEESGEEAADDDGVPAGQRRVHLRAKAETQRAAEEPTLYSAE